VGGLNINTQIMRLQEQPQFVIGTPGRLKDLTQRHKLKITTFTNVVLDEVDRMLDIGFRQDILFLIGQLPTNRQAAFFSATINGKVEEIMRQLMRNPEMVKVREQATTLQIHQDIVTIKPGENKVDVLHQLLCQAEFARVIVFGRTKRGVSKLERQLFDRGLRVTALHSNKSQSARQRSLNEFKTGRVQALLATDIVARGIDVDDVTHVINFDEPMTYDDYIHRIGRTGRAGKIGKALTFVS
jgi:superfamily II DNA/RNA helicase